jgi:hypothetical protein
MRVAATFPSAGVPMRKQRIAKFIRITRRHNELAKNTSGALKENTLHERSVYQFETPSKGSLPKRKFFKSCELVIGHSKNYKPLKHDNFNGYGSQSHIVKIMTKELHAAQKNGSEWDKTQENQRRGR